MENFINNRSIEELIHRFLVVKATTDEIKFLRNWIESDSKNKELFEQYREIWQMSQASKNKFNEQKAWNSLKKEILQTKQKSGHGKSKTLAIFARVAAIFILAYISGALAVYFSTKTTNPKNQITYTEYKVPYGSKSEIILPDKSKVWLNSGSVLKYSNKFDQNSREVYLEGEGFFDVSKNPQKPFLVYTSGITVRVLGTAFNVKAYPDEKTVETTVQRGLVQVSSNHNSIYGTQKILLHANQKAILDKIAENPSTPISTNRSKTDTLSSQPILVEKKPINITDHVDVAAVISWKEKNWIIERENLQSLAIKIERRYNVNMVFADSSLREFVFSGILTDESLEQVLNAIKLSAPVTYTVNQKKVTLYPKYINKPN